MADFQNSEMKPKFHPLTWGHAILRADRSSEDEQLSITPLSFLEFQAYEHGWRLKYEIHILYYQGKQ
jgi:hypothetical protein